MLSVMATQRRLAIVSIFVISFALLIDEIMLSAIFHVLLGAGNTIAAIAIALVGLSASGIFVYLNPSLQRHPEGVDRQQGEGQGIRQSYGLHVRH